MRIRLTPATVTTGPAATALTAAGVTDLTDLTVENGARQRVVLLGQPAKTSTGPSCSSAKA